MNYTEALNYIHTIPKFVRPLGNKNLKKLLAGLSNPHLEQKFIHLAGTNGKGSTASMLAEILKQEGYKTGLFTSPYIEVFNERIQINGKNISDEDLCLYVQRVKNAVEQLDAPVSEFAFITAVAFLYFKEQNCDFVVLETGMGGKLDATNVIEESVVSVLCSISFDHMQFLGDTLEKITEEKCGIIKEGGNVVSYDNGTLNEIIKAKADEKNADILFAKTPQITENGFIYDGEEYELSLKGTYQPYNAAVVLEIVSVMCKKDIIISKKSVKDGLKNTKWPVRFEFIKRNLVIDGGHNIDGISALKKSLLSLDKDIILVMAMMEDKSCRECMEEITPVAKYVITTQIDMPRCISAKELLDLSLAGGECVENPINAVEKALSMTDGNTVICVCGSLYLAGEVRKVFKDR